ncbi:MAG TPA: DUF2911 domain-containing protein, partial [Planctomycetaceae bacterium]|nr:DUF2911 domain-containing protein [Planctomycetaceae bacterium]
VLATVVGLLSTVPADAQRAKRKRVSPHETVSEVLDGNKVSVTYGRPYSKNPRGTDVRKIWGSLVPYGKAWRLGADEATTIVLQKGVKIGDAAVPAGTYTLYLIPEENGGKLAFSKTVGRWGIPVDQKNDLVRVDVKKEALSPALNQLAIAVEKADNGGVLKIKWEDSQYSVNFTNE